MTLMMLIKCDTEGCETTVSAAFNPSLTVVLTDAVKDLGWRVAPMGSRHFCPKHADQDPTL